MRKHSNQKLGKNKKSILRKNKADAPSKSNKALDSLIKIALTLPGIAAPAHAEQPISTNPKAEAFYSRYSENKNRYKIDTYQTNILFPVTSNIEIGFGAVRDLMSGASTRGYIPAFALPQPNPYIVIPGTSVDPAFFLTEIRTQQSIVDTRNQASAYLNYYLPDAKISFEGGYSTEDDFESFFANSKMELDFNKKNTIVYLGFGVAYNISRPSQTVIDFLQAFSTNPTNNRGKYNTERLSLGIKQDITKDFYVQQNAEIVFDNGDLYDPYKTISFNAPNTLNWPGAVSFGPAFLAFERRPHRRIMGAFVTNLVKHLPCFDSSLHFSYRYAANTWNIHSNTFELAYYQPFLKSWEIAPKVRYYTQDRASFYALSFHTTPTPLFLHSKKLRTNKASSDYRLANFGSIGYDITLTKSFRDPNIKISGTFGFTKRSTGFSLTKNKGPKNPSNQFHEKYVAVQLTSEFSDKLSFKKKEKCNATYKAGEFSITPITLSFTGQTFGRKHKDTKFVSASPFFNEGKFIGSMYRNQRGLGINDIHRNGLGYDLQMGYFLRDDIEVFADLGFINEKSLNVPTGVVTSADQAIAFQTNAFQFKNRTSYKTNLGAKYYFNTETTFTPFVGFMAGNIWQPKTKADVYIYDPFNQQIFTPKVGQFKIFNRQNLFNGALLTGLDYRFNEYFAASLSTGLYYYKRNKAKTLDIPATPFSAPNSYRISDYKNKIVVPVSISLKIIL